MSTGTPPLDWSADTPTYERFRLADGTSLAYVDRGSAEALVMVPGWSQTAAQFKFQIGPLSEHFRVLALDVRGHGESDRPEQGYRVSRLAADIREFVHGLGLTSVIFLAHSVGASVIWSYLDTYGQEGISRLVFVDEGSCVVAKPTWTAEERRIFGAAMSDVSEYADFYRRIYRAQTPEDGVELIRDLFSPDVPPDNLRWVATENLKLPRAAAADLMWDASNADWRDVFARIGVPTLVMGAEKSLFHADSQRWIAAQIPGSRVDICPADEGGSHFMFMENPERFNRVVLDFLTKPDAPAS